MKTITTLLLAVGLVTGAQAQSGAYKHAAARANFCTSMGGLASSVMIGRIKGEPKQKFLDAAASAMNTGDKGDALVRFAIDYGYDQATDAGDAHMTVWARCMDTTN